MPGKLGGQTAIFGNHKKEKVIFRAKRHNFWTAGLVAAVILAAVGLRVGLAEANDSTTQRFRDQLEDISRNIDQVHSDLDGIHSHQDTLEETIQSISHGIRHLDSEIGQTRQQLAGTRQLIGKYENEIDQQKGILKYLLQVIYQQSDTSDLELFLASDSFGDYIDQQANLSRLKTEVGQSVRRLTETTNSLRVEEQNREISLTNLFGQQETQESLRAEQRAVLAETEGQEALYQQRLKRLQDDYTAKQRELEAYLASLLRQQVTYGEVAAGDVIGKMGNTGWSTAPHLHMAIYADSSTKYDPLRYIFDNDLVWPVGGSGGYVSQGFKPTHQALDIAGPEGLPIRAVAAGKIIHRGCLWPGTRWATFGVILNHNNGQYYSLYIHLQAPNNAKYSDCNTNQRPPSAGGRYYLQKSIDYDITI